MIRIIFLLILFSFAAAATAEDASETLSPSQRCAKMSQLAEQIMDLRQTGASMASVMEIATGNELLVSIVVEAYKRNRYETKDMQTRATTDFANDFYLECFERLTEEEKEHTS
jgi:Sec7-like guanine-nucleotide exchange factor